jgi:hypothetical protein
VTVKVKKGDRVRVVLEGEVRGVEHDADFVIGPIGVDNFITQSAQHVVSVEVLAKQFKVGDTVSGDDYAKLPIGTVVVHHGFDLSTKRVKLSAGKYAVIGDNAHPYDSLDEPFVKAERRTIEYLP